MSKPSEDFGRYIRGYDQGIYTRLEVVSALIAAAARCPPAELAVHIPQEWLAQIRDKTAKPPGSVEDVCVIDGGLRINVDKEAHHAEMQDMQREWFDGAWKWHQYFNSVAASDVI